MSITPIEIDALLPQTQCTQCGYQGCLPYAEAIAAGAPHNQCPPGGNRVIAELSALLNRSILPLNPNNGVEKPKVWALIREADCIGCTKCIQACPTDAIIGSAKMMHTVMQKDCTGCGLCVTPCPTDCIELTLAPETEQPEKMPASQRINNSNYYRKKHYAHLIRQRKSLEDQHNQFKIRQSKNDNVDAKTFVQQAMARAQLQKSATTKVSKL